MRFHSNRYVFIDDSFWGEVLFRSIPANWGRSKTLVCYGPKFYLQSRIDRNNTSCLWRNLCIQIGGKPFCGLSLFVFITPVEIKRKLFGTTAFWFCSAGSWRAVSGCHNPLRQGGSPSGHSSCPESKSGGSYNLPSPHQMRPQTGSNGSFVIGRQVHL